jgi:hypothetical protein
MKRKMIDPWRAAPEPVKPSAKEERAQKAKDPDAVEEQHCVQFRGIKCGIHVWLDYEPTENDNPNADALEQLNALLCDLFDQKHDVALNAYGVYRDKHPDDLPVWTFSGHGTFYIRLDDGKETESVRAVSKLCYALRALQNINKEAAKLLQERNIKPYVM